MKAMPVFEVSPGEQEGLREGPTGSWETWLKKAERKPIEVIEMSLGWVGN